MPLQVNHPWVGGRRVDLFIKVKIILSISFQVRGLPLPKFNNTNKNFPQIFQAIITRRINNKSLELTLKDRNKDNKGVASEDQL